MDYMIKLKEKGAVRHVGITGHYDPHLLAAAVRQYPFETMLMPLNVLDPHYLSHEKIVLPELVKREMGIIAMKVTCVARIMTNGIATAEECLRYVWTLPVSTAILGCKNLEELEYDVRVAKNFTPVSAAEKTSLLVKTEPFKGTELEVYKKEKA